MSNELSAMVLAAGASRRLGEAKQGVCYLGEPLLRRTTRLARGAVSGVVLVVLGADAEQMPGLLGDLHVRVVHNSRWRDGIGTSIGVAARALEENADGVLILLADQWAVTPADLGALVQRWDKEPHRIVASGYQDCHGVPAVFPRSLFGELALLDGDTGARKLLRKYAQGVRVVALEHAAKDLDTPQDLIELRQHESQEAIS